MGPAATQAAEEYYGVSVDTVDLLLNWGPIVFIPVLPCVVSRAAHSGSLPTIVRTGALLCAVCCVLRLLPTWMPGTLLGQYANSRGIALVHLGHILNAAVGPIVMAPPPYLSSIWFGEKERTTATAVAVMANQLGAAVGFFAPWVVKDAADIPHLLTIHFVLSLITLVMVLVYFPPMPPTPPSPSASMAAALPAAHKASVWKEFTTAGLNPSFLLLALSGGISCGVYNAWTGSLDTILPTSIYTPKKAGWLGFASVMAAIVGGTAIGPLVDRVPALQHRHKSLILGIMLACSTASLLFTLSLPIAGKLPQCAARLTGDLLLCILPVTDLSDKGVIPVSFLSSGAIVLFTGLLQGAAQPLYYELGVELTYPVSETMSAGFIVQSNNVAALTLLFVMPNVNTNAVNSIVTLTFVAMSLVVVFVVERYRRVEAETASRAGGRQPSPVGAGAARAAGEGYMPLPDAVGDA